MASLLREHPFRNVLVGVISVCAAVYLLSSWSESHIYRAKEEQRNRLEEKLSVRSSQSIISCSGKDVGSNPAIMHKEGFFDCKQSSVKQGIFIDINYPRLLFKGDDEYLKFEIAKLKNHISDIINIKLIKNKDILISPKPEAKIVVREGESASFFIKPAEGAPTGDKILPFTVGSDIGAQTGQLQISLESAPRAILFSEESLSIISKISQIIGLPAILLLLANFAITKKA